MKFIVGVILSLALLELLHCAPLIGSDEGKYTETHTSSSWGYNAGLDANIGLEGGFKDGHATLGSKKHFGVNVGGHKENDQKDLNHAVTAAPPTNDFGSGFGYPYGMPNKPYYMHYAPQPPPQNQQFAPQYAPRWPRYARQQAPQFSPQYVPRYAYPPHFAPQYVPQYANALQSVPQYVPQYANAPQFAPQYVPQYANAPQFVPQYVPQYAYEPQYAPQNAPQQYVPQGAPQYTLQGAPQYAPQSALQYASQGALHYAQPNEAPDSSQPTMNKEEPE